MKTVLITGFEPFGGDARNPSQEIARALDGRIIGRRRVIGAMLPCVFDAAARELRTLLRKHQPELVVGLGLAGNRTEITPERIAINVDDARIPDNARQQPVDRPIVRGGPAGYWSTLPIKAIVAELQRRGVPASVSQTAGTFVCNHAFYALMHALQSRRGTRGGFIHIPWPVDSEAATKSTITLADMTTAIETAVAVALETRRDRRRSGGAVA